MFIAMNRFRIARGSEEVFEELWRKRESHLDGVPGFREFHLLRGPHDEEMTLFASHTVWDSEADFEAWINLPASEFSGKPNPRRVLDGEHEGRDGWLFYALVDVDSESPGDDP